MEVLEQRCKNLLLIDDDQDLRELLQSFLQGEGYVVETARDGSEGLKKLRQVLPCMVLVDFMMPVMNGEEFLHALKEDPNLCQIPVVMISASANLTNALLAQQFIPKPFHMDSLLDSIAKHARSYRDAVISQP